MVYENGVNFTNDTLMVYADVNNQYSWDGKPGFKAEYFSNKTLEGTPAFTRQEEKLEHFWQEGESLSESFPANNFSARYTTNYTADRDGEIAFELDADDGYRFFIEGEEVINAWNRNRWGARIHKLRVEKGKTYKLVVEYHQGEGKASVKLRTGYMQKTDFSALAQRLKDADAIVFVGGISPQLEGEEMRVDYPGFNGGDRTSILLPAVQTGLMKALKSTGKPIVFVMMTGSAVAIPWEAQNIPGIVNAWYAGQSAGTAIADVLFGDYNPAGRLPVTFYKGDSDLPDFNDYSMKNRTYRYFTGEALYPFGFGLSYTTFQYDQLNVVSASGGKPTQVSVRVTNSGSRDGEEVVQLYVSHSNTKPAPLRALKGFQRIELKAGESRVVNFVLTADDLSVVNANGEMQAPKGPVTISVGGGQPAQAVKSSGNIVTGTVTM